MPALRGTEAAHLGTMMAAQRLAFSLVAIAAGSCTVADDPSDPVDPVECGELGILPGTMEGAPLITSNNPESVNREGLLMSTTQLVPTAANLVRRTLSSVSLDARCPDGSLKEFAFYMHHLNQLGRGARYYVLVEPPAGTSATFNAYGAAVTQLDTGSLDPGRSPSYHVSRAVVAGALPSGFSTRHGSQFVNVSGTSIRGPHALISLSADPSTSVDARVEVRATSGCLVVRVVAATAANGSVARADALGKRAFAWGNVPSTASTSGGAPCTDASSIGWGRPAGTYRHERWAGAFSTVSITSASSVNGWKLLAAPANREVNGVCEPGAPDPSPSSNAQRSPALSHYRTNTSGQTEGRDSDPFSTGNYGAEYTLAVPVRNTTAQCVTARLVIASYPGGRRCSEVPIASSKTRHYDGAARVTQDGTQLAPVRLFTKCPDGNRSSTVATKRLQAGQTVNWNLKFFVPGLISIPQGLLLVTDPC